MSPVRGSATRGPAARNPAARGSSTRGSSARGSAAALAALLAGAALSGCGARSDAATQEAAPPPVASAPAAPTAPAAPSTAPPAPDAASGGVPTGPPPSPGRMLGARGSWKITTYYTAVESFHHGRPKAVRGCPELHCSHGTAPLGSYPSDFLDVVRTEGSGRLTSGPNAGRYLNWSHSVGWWLDTTTRDAGARPLRAWGSAAADRSVLARGQRFAVTGCGRDDAGKPVPAHVCAAFRNATWTVTDLFRPGYGGEHHADVYIGEETGPGFTDYYTTLTGATISAA
ncbi:hypothetical protein [Actinomadura atramentaria]|uniref:hypothetical protein n=1 Tax=Actinomadura atramentaria TaxID=1990 RepID=UPI001F0B37D8|nr:hypothetical protein [Actinomadura atramentaria]